MDCSTERFGFQGAEQKQIKVNVNYKQGCIQLQTGKSRMKTAVLPSYAQGFARFGLALCLAAVLSGCGGKTNNATNAASNGSGQNGSQNAGGASPAVSGAMISDADARQFSDKMIHAIQTNDVTTIANMIDVDALVKAGVADLDIPHLNLTEMSAGARSSLTLGSGLPAQLAASVAKGGSCDLLRYLEVDHQKRARMRLIFPNNGGLNYIDFVLGRDAAGQVAAQDMYIFYSGELLSNTMRRMAVQMAAQSDRSLLERLKGAEPEFVKHVSDIRDITSALAEKRTSDAARIYEGLPASLKQDKTLQLAHIRIAQQQGDAQYTQALTQFRASFPNDPASELLSIDYYALNKQYDKALQALDKLDKAVGGDPYLNVMRAFVYITRHQMPQAQQFVEKAAHDMPTSQNVNQLLAIISALNKHYDLVPGALKAVKQANGTLPDVANAPEFAGFRRSPQYKEWQKMQ